ncbi:MAG: hypothetical protein R6V67_07970 [Spirochaetia bacterium]
MRKIFPVLITVITLTAILGCGSDEPAPAPTGFAPGQTTEAYDYVHGGYVGKAEVTVNEDGSLDATLDEAFLPHTLAIVDIESDEWDEDNTASYVVRGDEVHVAKYISYDGTNYTGETVGTALAYVASGDDGEPEGNTILEKAILKDEETMKAWFENIQDGKFQIFTEFGGDAEPVTTTDYGSLTKRGSSYWDFDIGWQGNIEAVEEAVMQHGVGYSLDEMNRDEESGEWSLADATTSATLSDFKHYVSLVQTAVGRLEME